MSKLKLDSDFEKVRKSHLSIQSEFVNKIQSRQFNKFEKHMLICRENTR